MEIIRSSQIQSSFRTITGNQTDLQKLDKLSNGIRMSRASEDVSKLGISDKMRAQIMGIEEEQQDAQDAISLIQTVDTALFRIYSALGDMAKLIEKSANAAITDRADIDAVQSDFSDLLSSIDEISGSMTFNGVNVLFGTRDAQNAPDIDPEEQNYVSELYAKHVKPFSSLSPDDIKLAGARIGTPQDAGLAAGKIREAIDAVSATRDDLRGHQTTLEQKLRSLAVAGENMNAAGSRIQDVNMAKEILASTKRSVLSQSGLAAISQASVQAQSVLNLIK